LRQIMFVSDGDLLGVNVNGDVIRFHDANGDGVFDSSELTRIVAGSGNGSNCHLDASTGYLYAGTPDGVMRWMYDPASADLGVGEAVVTGQPGDGNHPKHTVHVYDGYLYVHSGSSGNASDPMSPAYDTDRSLLRRFQLSALQPGQPFAWSSGEVFS